MVKANIYKSIFYYLTTNHLQEIRPFACKEVNTSYNPLFYNNLIFLAIVFAIVNAIRSEKKELFPPDN